MAICDNIFTINTEPHGNGMAIQTKARCTECEGGGKVHCYIQKTSHVEKVRVIIFIIISRTAESD